MTTVLDQFRVDSAGGGVIRSSVAIRYQLGLLRQAGSLIAPLSASTPSSLWQRGVSLRRALQALR